MSYKIGVDGGGTKTECILVDEAGTVVAVHVGAGSNPGVVGAAAARSIVSAALESMRAHALTHHAGATRAPFSPPPALDATLLCMAGSTDFWREFAAGLTGFGRVTATDDALPVLELALRGGPGVVLHAGTGSFVAARTPDGAVHYAGGLGWRFGDPGSGYDLGRRAVAGALLDLQGWRPAPRLAALVGESTGLEDAATLTRYYYADTEAGLHLAALAGGVLRLAEEDDPPALALLLASTGGLLDLALGVTEQLFGGALPAGDALRLSGPILTHPVVVRALAARSPMPLAAVDGKPIEGVRRLLEKS